ncbi:MAG: PadR family transcriptional regulator [Candidatus Hodarchaeota archaeon]
MPKHADFIKSLQTNTQHSAKAMRRLVRRTTTENLWLYVLTLLEERNYFAYELRNAVKERFGVEMASVTGYVLFYKLQRDGLVELSEKRREGNRPTRKYYRITDMGRRSLADAKEFLQLLVKVLAAPPT